MTEHVEGNTNSFQDTVVVPTSQDLEVDDILKDLMKRLEILRKLGLPAGDPSVLTPSGKATGGGNPPMWYPFPMFAPWNPAPSPHVARPLEQPILVPIDDQPVEEDVVDLLIMRPWNSWNMILRSAPQPRGLHRKR